MKKLSFAAGLLQKYLHGVPCLNSFPLAFRPENGPFIVKSCHTRRYGVIDVTGFSRACLAKTVLRSPVKYENQRSRSEVCDLAARLG
jgi:hypothetical protein